MFNPAGQTLKSKDRHIHLVNWLSQPAHGTGQQSKKCCLFSAEVKFTDWKAKDGECSKCSEGGGGPIVIEGKCEAETGSYSCKGLKNTKESKECVKYCDSNAQGKIN